MAKNYSSKEVYELIDREAKKTGLQNSELARRIQVNPQTLKRARTGLGGSLVWERMTRILNFFGFEVILRRKPKE